jgi:hypothetical protein
LATSCGLIVHRITVQVALSFGVPVNHFVLHSLAPPTLKKRFPPTWQPGFQQRQGRECVQFVVGVARVLGFILMLQLITRTATTRTQFDQNTALQEICDIP